RPYIILPTSVARKLNQWFQCTLSKQKCSIDRALNKDNFDDQMLDPRFESTEDSSSEEDTMEVNASLAGPLASNDSNDSNDSTG
ncbi:MAG: hypothetical protein TREMPRED_003309, partial [Tremellales sp. Tagirdzhanova-0007]